MIVLLTATVAVTGLLTGCSDLMPGQPSETSAAPAPQNPSSTPTDAASPQLVPEGTAAENLPLFAHTVAEVWAGEQRQSGRAYIDALAAAGFDKSRMQVTQDRSTVGKPAESLQFSLAWGGDCLVGQVGPSTGEQPVTAVMDQLAEGRCLVGSTRPIDW